MSLISASAKAEVDGYIGYMEPYATSHQELDDDGDFQEETRNAARSLAAAVRLDLSGQLQNPGRDLIDPNPK
jgi:hypothetical protein